MVYKITSRCDLIMMLKYMFSFHPSVVKTQTDKNRHKTDIRIFTPVLSDPLV